MHAILDWGEKSLIQGQQSEHKHWTTAWINSQDQSFSRSYSIYMLDKSMSNSLTILTATLAGNNPSFQLFFPALVLPVISPAWHFVFSSSGWWNFSYYIFNPWAPLGNPSVLSSTMHWKAIYRILNPSPHYSTTYHLFSPPLPISTFAH